MQHNTTKCVGDISINSYNTRGLKDDNKREKLLQHLDDHYPGIHCLQETHLNDRHEKALKNKYGSNCYFSHGTNYSRGVCIISPKRIKFELLSTEKDNDGRYIIVNGKFNNIELTIINIYAPTQDRVGCKNKLTFIIPYLKLLQTTVVK